MKNEKYIREITTAAGTKMLKIEIRAYDQTFRKSIKISDFTNKAEALRFACQIRDEVLVKMRQGYTVSKFKTVRDIYLKTFDLFPVRVKTRKKHDIFYNHAIDRYGSLSIDKVTSADIQESINQYALTHTKRQVSGLLAIWRRIYKACAMLNINVIDRTVPVVIPECIEGKKRSKEISPADLDAFCEALLNYNAASVAGSYRSQAVYYAIQIMKYCGLRPAETFALTKSDIDIAAGVIRISKAAHSTITQELDISKAKTETSHRNVPIPAELKPILEECLLWSRNEILFSDYYGRLMDIDDIDTLIGNVRKKSKINFNLYMLRHQFSTDLMTDGTPPNIVRDLMGHKSANMSLDYAVSRPEDMENAINKRRFS